MEGRVAKVVVRLGAAFTLFFLYLPLAVVFIYAFNESVAQAWPPTGFTTRWFEVAWNSPDVRESLFHSVVIGLVAAGIAVVLGTLASFAVHRYRFFGRETISFALVLPIALPGIITGMALRSAYNTTGVKLGLVDDHDRPRDLLRRGRVQQRGRPSATDVGVDRRGVDGPGRRRVADVPARHAADDRDGAGRRRPARLRAVVR